MIKKTLHLAKMQTALGENNIAQYQLQDMLVNDWLEKKLTIEYFGQINCVSCGRLTKKSFAQGYCFPCMRALPECDSCILKPELCHYHQETCRDSHWGEMHCIKPHYVYLANTSKAKVGITRQKNLPMRWIDQGAVQALPIIKVNERLLSGLVEVQFKNHVHDKTSWQAMLKSRSEEIDLLAYKNEILAKESTFIQKLQEQYGDKAIEVVSYDQPQQLIHYPVLQYPEKVKAHNLDKTPKVEGTVLGIKGQYLILDTGVINIRKFSGYQCDITIV